MIFKKERFNYFSNYLILSHPDNATAGNGFLTPLHILPEWYFLPFFAILKALPNKNAGFIILFYFLHHQIIYFSLFGSAGLNRSLSQFPSFILLLLALGWIGCQLPKEEFISYGRIFLILLLLFALYVLDPSFLFVAFSLSNTRCLSNTDFSFFSFIVFALVGQSLVIYFFFASFAFLPDQVVIQLSRN